jgi:hypothetical protein
MQSWRERPPRAERVTNSRVLEACSYPKKRDTLIRAAISLLTTLPFCCDFANNRISHAEV